MVGSIFVCPGFGFFVCVVVCLFVCLQYVCPSLK